MKLSVASEGTATTFLMRGRDVFSGCPAVNIRTSHKIILGSFTELEHQSPTYRHVTAYCNTRIALTDSRALIFSACSTSSRPDCTAPLRRDLTYHYAYWYKHISYPITAIVLFAPPLPPLSFLLPPWNTLTTAPFPTLTTTPTAPHPTATPMNNTTVQDHTSTANPPCTATSPPAPSPSASADPSALARRR